MGQRLGYGEKKTTTEWDVKPAPVVKEKKKRVIAGFEPVTLSFVF